MFENIRYFFVVGFGTCDNRIVLTGSLNKECEVDGIFFVLLYHISTLIEIHVSNSQKHPSQAVQVVRFAFSGFFSCN